MRAKFVVLEQTHGIRLHAKFGLYRFILTPCGAEKPKILPFFELGILRCAIWHQSEKVEHG